MPRPAACPPPLGAWLARRDPRLSAAALFLLATTLPTLGAALLDERELADVNVWIKPLKFELALALYAGTLALMAGWLPESLTRRRAWAGYLRLVLACIAVELVWIAGSAALGKISHFDVSTPAASALYSAMGVAAVTLTTASLAFGLAFLLDRSVPLAAPFRLSLVLGLCMTFVATVLVAGRLAGNGTHLVGGDATDAQALFALGWARDGGDLRVAHFFATHAMHGVPLVGWIAARGLSRRVGIGVVLVAAALYAALIVFTFEQALAGRPFLAFPR